MPFAGQPLIGQFYIQKENQDFWLYELVDGVPQWVRKGNIRDEGTSGIVGVQPNIALGFAQEVIALDRWKILPSVTMLLGADEAVAKLERIMLLPPAGNTSGFDMSADVRRIRQVLPVGPMSLGFDAEATFGQFLQVSMTFGVSQQQAFIKYLQASSTSAGFTQAITLLRIKAIAASMALGSSQATAVTRTRLLGSVAVSLGFSDAIALSHSAPQPTTRPTYSTHMVASTSVNTSNVTTNGDSVSTNQYVVVHVVITRNGGVPATVSSVTDSIGNTYTKIGSIANNAVSTAQINNEVWAAKSSGSNAANQVTVNFSGTISAATVVATVFSNVNTTNAQSATATFLQNNAASSAAPSGTTVNTVYNNSLLIALRGDVSGNGTPVGDPAWTEWGGLSTGAPQANQDHYRRSFDASTAYTISSANWASSANWTLALISLKGT